MLSPAEQASLLQIARRAIAQEMTRRHRLASAGTTAADDSPPVPVEQQGGAFVTLRIDGELRGCIGYIEYPGPVRTAVDEVARKAAFDDPRFEPLEPHEFDRIAIEISVLTPMRRITSPEDVTIGRDGLVIEMRGRRGLLLPQVATEYGWDAEEFLAQTCHKAGLPAQAWRDRAAALYAFSAQVFAEHDAGGPA